VGVQRVAIADHPVVKWGIRPASAGPAARPSGAQTTEIKVPETIFPPKEFDPADFGLPEETGLESAAPIRLPESQCGAANESQDVESYDGTLGVSVAFVAAHQRPVGQTMRGNRRSCSGTLIGHDLFITAGHCFDANPNPQTQVTFNFQNDPAGNPRTEERFPIVGVLEHRLGGLDYEIIRLGNNPGGTFGFALVSGADAGVGDLVAIIGHPATVPKQIEAGPVLALDGNQIRYNQTDTLPGNSGSGILHAGSGRLVGVHTNGGCAGTDPETGFNLGMRVSSLVAASPILSGLVDAGNGIFAGIWEAGGGPPFIARHGLSAADYQAAFDQAIGQGFRLTCVSGYTVGGQDRYAAIWQQDGGPAFAARHGLSAGDYQATFDELVGQGFRLTCVSGYTVGGEDRYAAIWQQDGGPAFAARHGLTAGEYQETFDALVGAGMRLRRVAGFGRA
jgi:V8-like Glu-specific endopeptidase